jgi:hypothetical protein
MIVQVHDVYMYSDFFLDNPSDMYKNNCTMILIMFSDLFDDLHFQEIAYD